MFFVPLQFYLKNNCYLCSVLWNKLFICSILLSNCDLERNLRANLIFIGAALKRRLQTIGY